MENNNCVFCKIVSGEINSSKVYEDDFCIVFKNIEPVAEIHLLICPKQHVPSLLDVDSSFEFNRLVDTAQKVIKDLKIESGYKLVLNGGKYLSVPHLHWHLLAGKLEDSDDILNNT
jgi:histidine triad (HIT) family protein